MSKASRAHAGRPSSARLHADESSSLRRGWSAASADINIRLLLNVSPSPSNKRVISATESELGVATASAVARPTILAGLKFSFNLHASFCLNDGNEFVTSSAPSVINIIYIKKPTVLNTLVTMTIV